MTATKNLEEALVRLGLEQILPSDEGTFRDFWRASPNPRYADSWVYVLQSVNGYHLGLSRLGYKVVTDDALLAANIFHRPTDGVLTAHLVNPVGKGAAALTCRIAAALVDTLRLPVYVKNIRRETAEEIATGLPGRVKQPDPWHPEAPLEDNTEPEMILSVRHSLDLLHNPSKNQVKDKYGRFVRKMSDHLLNWHKLVLEREMDAQRIVHGFFSRKRAHHIDISGPEDYQNMVVHRPSNDGLDGNGSQILYIDDEPVALLVLEGLGESEMAGVYCNLALYQEIHYLSEYVIVEACRLARAHGFRFLNLGGSESANLTEFKRKFQPVQEDDSSVWLMVT